ncbi:hypothetical protein BTVI_85711 [Pitangus sulphuratus]|nr:hypothetical protein BTVI_85711 [Pitangus sulphuratus]
MGSALRKPELPIYNKIRAVIDYQGHKYDKASLKALATWINSHQLQLPEDLNIEHWDKLGATLWKAEKRGDKIAAKALIAWRLIYMLLQDRQKGGLCTPAVNSATTQDGGSKPSPSPTNMAGPNTIRDEGQNGAGTREHCMPRGEHGGVGKHSVTWDYEGGAVGGVEIKDQREGPPQYTPPDITSSFVSAPHDIIDTPQLHHVMSPPLSHDHASFPATGPAFPEEHGHAHNIGPETYLPKAYPPLPPRPTTRPTTSLPHYPPHPTAPEEPHRPESLAKAQVLLPPVAFWELSFKSKRTRRTITQTPTCHLQHQSPSLPPKQQQPSTTKPSTTKPNLSPRLTSPSTSCENITNTDSEEEIKPSPLTHIIKTAKSKTPTDKLHRTHSFRTPTSRASAIKTLPTPGDAGDIYTFPAATTTQEPITPGPWVDITHEVVEAQEKAWRVFHEQASLTGDLEMLRAFPIIKEDGKPPQWRPISYPVLKDIKKAITDHGLNSPYTISLLDSFFNSFDLTPNDIRQVASAWLPTLQYAAFKAEWKSLIKKYVKEGGDIRGMTHEQAIDRLYGEGAYTSNAKQAMTHISLIHKNSELAFKAIKKVAKISTATPSYTLIFQGPKEPFFDFATRLKDAIVKQTSDTTSQDILFKS